MSESLSVGTGGDDISPLFVTTILESGVPTTATVGFVGQFYVNTDNDELYYCSDANGGVYTWKVFTATIILNSGVPTVDTVGFVGQIYINTDNDNIYYCY